LTSTPIHEIPVHKPVDDGLEPRYLEAWQAAFSIARLLKNYCNADDVRITGSLLDRDRFHEESDIDLVVTNFTMADSFNCNRHLEAFSAWSIDIIPLLSLTPARQALMVERSVPLET